MSDRLVHDAEETSQILGGLVSARWLTDQAAADAIPHTRLAERSRPGWTDQDIADLLEKARINPVKHGQQPQRRRGSKDGVR